MDGNKRADKKAIGRRRAGGALEARWTSRLGNRSRCRARARGLFSSSSRVPLSARAGWWTQPRSSRVPLSARAGFPLRPRWEPGVYPLTHKASNRTTRGLPPPTLLCLTDLGREKKCQRKLGGQYFGGTSASRTSGGTILYWGLVACA